MVELDILPPVRYVRDSDMVHTANDEMLRGRRGSLETIGKKKNLYVGD